MLFVEPDEEDDDNSGEKVPLLYIENQFKQLDGLLARHSSILQTCGYPQRSADIGRRA